MPTPTFLKRPLFPSLRFDPSGLSERLRGRTVLLVARTGAQLKEVASGITATGGIVPVLPRDLADAVDRWAMRLLAWVISITNASR